MIYETKYGDALMHHGVKGMRWGQRKLTKDALSQHRKNESKVKSVAKMVALRKGARNAYDAQRLTGHGRVSSAVKSGVVTSAGATIGSRLATSAVRAAGGSKKAQKLASVAGGLVGGYGASTAYANHTVKRFDAAAKKYNNGGYKKKRTSADYRRN